MPSSDEISYLLKRAIPDALDPIVRRAVGTVIPRLGEGGRYRILHAGSFSSRVAADLLAFGRNQKLAGALIVLDDDVLRAIYYRAGRVVGVETNVLFERLGRVLLRAGSVAEGLAEDLVEREERQGVAAAAALVTGEVARWGLETRAWDITAALFLVHGGHYLIVDGTPDLGTLEPLDLSPMDLALEGLRRYDEWRRSGSDPLPERPAPSKRPPEAPRKAPSASTSAAVDQLMRQLRDGR